MFVAWYIEVFGGQSSPIPINGHFSKFSLIVMSFESRMLPLKVRTWLQRRSVPISTSACSTNNEVSTPCILFCVYG